LDLHSASVNIRAMHDVPDIVRSFFSAWTLRDPAIAASLVTEDVKIIDPNNNAVGPAALVEHLHTALHHFDFAVDYGQCWGDPEDFVFLCRITLTGRSTHFANVRTGFDPAVVVKMRDGLIASWIEYWDPRELNKALSRPAK
jgi:ketosteroid isomerase-like protein